MKGAIIYISSNREHPDFERKVVEDMMSKKGDLPVFAVTQKPMDVFENNMVVGDVGASGFNFCRQLQKVVDYADSDYVISCEADCLYSPDYFTFVPPEEEKVYRNTNNYVLTHGIDAFYEKDSQTAFQVADRLLLSSRLDFLLDGQPEWDTEQKNFPKEIGEPFLTEWETFETEHPCFGMKTNDGMRKQTRHGKEGFAELPYWGTAKGIKEKYYVSE